MAMLEIRKYPDKILRQRAAEVTEIGESERELILDMLDTMYFNNGIGLAAPQVGVLKRIIVGNPTGQKEDEFALVNPRIIERKGKRIEDCEGCLSIPEMSAEVLRFSKVVVRGKDINGKDITLEAQNLLARVICHETDHLNGVLFIDKVGFFKRSRLLRKYRKKMGISCIGRSY